MANTLIACVIFVVLTGVAAEMCDYELYPDERERTAYCSYGCCYTMIYPCCSEPFYVSAGFIAPMVIGSIGLFVTFVVIVVVIVVRRKRMQAVPTVHYTSPQMVTTAGGVTTYPGYGNTQFIAQPVYPHQPVNGTTPLYGMQQQVPGGMSPMYTMPAPNGAPPAYAQQYAEGTAPAYAQQYAEGTAPIYATQTAGEADPVPTKTPLQ